MQDQSKIPVHVSIIMDGNGRWAKERGQERVFGHKNGVQSVKACVEQAGRRGVKYLSLFAFSEENWERPKDEVNTLMDMMMSSIREEVNNLRDNGVRFLVLGNRERLSKPLQAAIASLEATTKDNTVLTLIVFLSYSGKWDISQAALKMAAAGDTNLEKYLVTNGIHDPDLIIRTSGEQRISNFMLWQAAYSEWYFPETLWPDFREEQFDKALEEYAKRDRLYGKVK